MRPKFKTHRSRSHVVITLQLLALRLNETKLQKYFLLCIGLLRYIIRKGITVRECTRGGSKKERKDNGAKGKRNTRLKDLKERKVKKCKDKGVQG